MSRKRFVARVKIEEQLTDVAAMAGMASGDVAIVDLRTPTMDDPCHYALNHGQIGFELNQEWQASGRMGCYQKAAF